MRIPQQRNSVRLRLLGVTRIETAEGLLDPSAEVAFGAALYLILERNGSVRREPLANILWPMVEPPVRLHRLRQTLLKLRKLGIPIDASAAGHLQINPGDVAIDLDEWLQKPDADDDEWNSSLGILPGYDPGFSKEFLEWVDLKRMALGGQVTRVLCHALADHRAHGRWREAVRVALKVLTLDRYSDEATQALAEGYWMLGRRADALSAIDRHLSILEEDWRPPALITMRKRIADSLLRPSNPSHIESPLIGRDEAIEALVDQLKQATDGRGQVCSVTGEPGSGKSRLAVEFRALASLRGVKSVGTHCRPSDKARPLSVFVDIVPRLRALRGAAGCSPETLACLEKLTTHSSRVVASDSGADGAFLYAQVERSVYDLFDAVVDEQPLIVVIEDIHWVDTTSARILHDMVDWAEDRALFFILTSREQTRLSNAPANHLRQLVLQPLSKADSKAILVGVVVAHGHSIGDAYVEWCVNVAEGNPYFLHELATQWVETGQEHKLPTSLTAVLQQRIDALDVESLLVLQSCAILEKNASTARLERMLALPPHVLFRSLSRLADAGMLVSDQVEDRVGVSDRLACKHDLLASAVLSRLSSVATAFLHRRAGSILEGDLKEHPSAALLWACAKHWEKVGEAERAFGVASSCADHLMELGLPSDAADAYEKTLSFSRSQVQRVRTLEGLARAFFHSGNWRQLTEITTALAALKDAIEPNRSSHDEFELLRMRADWQTLEWEVTLRQANVCLAAEDAEVAHRIQAGIMALMLLDWTCDYPRMDNVYAELQRLLEQTSSQDSSRHQAEMVYHTVRGDLSRAVLAAEKVVAEEKRHQNVGQLIRALCNSAVTYRTIGDFAKGRSVLAEAISIVDQHRIPSFAPRVLQLWINMALEEGDNEEIERLWQMLLERPAGADDPYLVMQLQSIRIRLALLHDDAETAQKLITSDLAALDQDAILFRKTYQAAIHVATQLATAHIADHRFVTVLENAHLQSRGACHQAFAAFTLYAALKSLGRQERAEKLLAEYKAVHRREPWPAPEHLLRQLMRLLN